MAVISEMESRGSVLCANIHLHTIAAHAYTCAGVSCTHVHVRWCVCGSGAVVADSRRTADNPADQITISDCEGLPRARVILLTKLYLQN